MILYNFDHQTNRKLIELRGISFEEVIAILENEGPIDIIKHPNCEKYSHQRMYVVELNNYIYLVPFIDGKNEIFLKTIYPSRKAVKQYFGAGGE